MASRRFTRYAWFVVGYTVLVVLWGAVVRATGSGAGCGSHWPSCNGQIIPQPEQIETLIEFSHRVTSGLSGAFVLALVVWAFRLPGTTRFTRWMAVLSLAFVLLEGAVGAALVRLDLVGDNASAARAVVIAIHLVNTYALLAFLALTAWGSATGKRLILRLHGRAATLLVFALAATVFLSAAGAVTALGDTLFPPETLTAGIMQDFDATANFLVRLRVIHPVLALLTSAYLFWVGQVMLATSAAARRHVFVMYGIVAAQIVAGFVNVVLLAPVWMQVIHLLLADLLWLTLVLTGALVLAEDAPVQTVMPGGRT